MNEVIKRGMISFSISSFAGLMVNLLIDSIVNAAGVTGFMSASQDYVALFATPVIAGYVNVLLYGLIGAVFALMTFVFDMNRIGFWIQWILYFIVTGAVCIGITVFVWQLHKVPQAFFCTIGGYGITYLIIGSMQFKKLKADIRMINEKLA